MKTLKINEKDNVAVVIKTDGNVPEGHKVAIKDIKKGEDIIKYGQVIGVANEDIKEGSHVHSHNIHTKLGEHVEYHYNPADLKDVRVESPYKLYGYKRKNGRVGIRNELWVVITVGCISSVAKEIVKTFKESHPCEDIDGVFTFSHQFGCSQMGEDQDATIKILQGIATHPNAGAVLLIGLGCENNQLGPFFDGLGEVDPNRIRYFNCQEVDDEIGTGVKYLEELYENMRFDSREEIEFKDIILGLECGGSDGFSGISANPLLGKVSDRVISYGGNVILSEVPEMFGAEHLLMNRARNEKVFNDIVKMINDYKDYFVANNQVVYENPSPGNKAGGITTLEDKSCGCITKGGTSIIDGTINYGDRLIVNGLNLLYGPGNDVSSTTGIGAAGAQIILFTTGRGTPYGSFMPTVKVATNSKVYNKKKRWFDFNAGITLEDKTLDEACDIFMKDIVDYINGDKHTRNEILEYREIAFFKRGVIL